MLKDFKRFLLWQTIVTAVVILLATAAFGFFFQDYYTHDLWIILGVILILTSILHYNLLKTGVHSPAKFSSRFMMMNGLKMIIYLVFIVVYAMIFPHKAVSFLVCFLILYLIYTILEVSLLLRFFKN